VEESYSEACYLIERVLHIKITPDYPFARFLEQLSWIEKDPAPVGFPGQKKNKGFMNTMGG